MEWAFRGDATNDGKLQIVFRFVRIELVSDFAHDETSLLSVAEAGANDWRIVMVGVIKVNEAPPARSAPPVAVN